MGIFDFFKSDDEKQAAEAKEKQAEVQQAVADNQALALSFEEKLTALGLDVQGLGVRFAANTARLTGTATDDVRDRLVVALGNMDGVMRVDDQMEIIDDATYAEPEWQGAQPEAVPEPMLVQVQKGDTLGSIAKDHLGSSALYKTIYEANTPPLTDPNVIEVGQVLRIPRRIRYEVQKGDTLSAIAKTFYGDAKKYPLIVEANKPTVPDANRIEVGMPLWIPLKPKGARIS